MESLGFVLSGKATQGKIIVPVRNLTEVYDVLTRGKKAGSAPPIFTSGYALHTQDFSTLTFAAIKLGWRQDIFLRLVALEANMMQST